MKPDRDTYEAWLLDRMEGRLSPQQKEALEAFLRAHPDLYPTARSFPTIGAEGLAFEGKEGLRRDYPPSGAPDAARLDDFLVARLHKELSPQQAQQLARYLYEHPGAGRQATLMALTELQPHAVPFADKTSLHRQLPPTGSPDVHRLTDFLIAEQEGDLSDDQLLALHSYVAAHPEAERERVLLAHSRLRPGTAVFPGKHGLKKRPARVLYLWGRLAAAASVLLLLGIGIWFFKGPGEGPVQVVQTIETPGSTVEQPAPLVHAPVERPAVHSGKGPQPRAPLAVAPGSRIQQRSIPASGTPITAQPVPEEGPAVEPFLPAPLEPQQPLIAEEAPAARGEEVAEAPPVVPVEHALNAERTTVTAADQRVGEQSVGHFLANAVREKLLDRPARSQHLDDRDALALADKAVKGVTQGTGALVLQETEDRQRFKVKLGRNFSMSVARAK